MLFAGRGLKETASFTGFYGVRFRTPVLFSPSLNRFLLNEINTLK